MPKIEREPRVVDEPGHGIGDLTSDQHGADAVANLHHGERHDEGRYADPGDAEGGDAAEREAGRNRQYDGEAAGQRNIGDVHARILQREEGDHDARRVGHAGDAQVDLGGQDNEGKADRDDRR